MDNGNVKFDSHWVNSKIMMKPTLPGPSHPPVSKKQQWIWDRRNNQKALQFARTYGGITYGTQTRNGSKTLRTGEPASRG